MNLTETATRVPRTASKGIRLSVDSLRPMPLLVTPSCKEGESYPGYLLRMANDNGYDGLCRLANILHLDRRHGRLATVDTSQLMRLLGISAKAFPPKPQESRAIEKLDGSKKRSILHYGWPMNVAWCPICLAEDEYWRADWDSPLALVCTKHACLLARKCGGCAKPVTILRPSLLQCRCGLDLRSAPAIAAAESDLLFGATDQKSSSRFLTEIRQLPNYDQERNLFYILRLLKIPSIGKRCDAIATLMGSEIGRKFLRAPDQEIANAIQRHLTSRRTMIIRRKLPFKCLVPMLWEIVSQIRPTGAKERRNFAITESFDVYRRMSERGFVALADLCLLFGDDLKQWNTRCAGGIFRTAKKVNRRGHPGWRLAIEEVDEIKELYASTLTTEQAAERLRIAPYQVNALVRLRVLRRVFDERRFAFPRYRIQAVDDVIEMLEALAFPVSDVPEHSKFHQLSAVFAYEKENKQCVGWTVRMAAVLCGDIPLYGPVETSKGGLGSFIVPVPKGKRFAHLVESV